MEKERKSYFDIIMEITITVALVILVGFTILFSIALVDKSKEEKEYKPHYDINHDGIVSIEDANTILDYSTGKINSICPLADINQDGKINSSDAYEILKVVSGKTEA